MSLAGLHGRALTRLCDDLRTLLAQGEAPSSSLRALDAVKGLWSERGDVAVASAALVPLLDQLPNPSEALPAVLSLMPEARAAWLRVVRARLSEMGERGDVVALTEAINSAGVLAGRTLKYYPRWLSESRFLEKERPPACTLCTGGGPSF